MKSIGVSLRYRLHIIPVPCYPAQCLTTYINTHSNTTRNKKKKSNLDLSNGRKRLLMHDRPDMVCQGPYFGFYHNMNIYTRNLNRESRNKHKFFIAVWLFKVQGKPKIH